MKMETGKLIKELRIKKGMTQEELADKTEISARTIQRIENGEVDPRAYTLQMIAKALEVDFSVFTEDESEEEKDLDIDSKRTWLALIHLSGILPLFIPTIMIWNRKKAEIKEMAEHYRAVLAFQSTILFMCLLGFWVLYNAKNPRVILIFLLLGGLFSIMNTFNVLNGKPYKYFGIFRAQKNRTRFTFK
jgi:transcriptional regulator with XRE-family HTH domain